MAIHPARNETAQQHGPGSRFRWLFGATQTDDLQSDDADDPEHIAERRHDFVMGLRVQLAILQAHEERGRDSLQRWLRIMDVPPALARRIQQGGATRSFLLVWKYF